MPRGKGKPEYAKGVIDRTGIEIGDAYACSSPLGNRSSLISSKSCHFVGWLKRFVITSLTKRNIPLELR